MKILVLNCGSSSLKYQLIDMKTEEVLASGKYERIGEDEAFITHKVNGQKIEITHPAKNHEEAIDFTLKQLIHPEYKVVDSLDEIEAIGHRLAHGGMKITQSVVIDDDVIAVLKECTDLAPLHNPAGIIGVEACKRVMPGKPMVGVFDTAFHQTIPEERYLYPIPYEYYEKYGVRKYGFHGTSHMYVSKRLAEIENTPIENLKIITCHLGQGSSVCAVEAGRSVDTSMGLTPLAGVPMVTRSGDIDPSVVTFLMKKENKTADEIETILNKKSGVQGISGLAPDFRVIENESVAGNKRALVAMNNFKYSVAGFIAKYAAAMNGVDAIIFTGGVGENQINIRKGICERLGFMGVELDEERNNVRSEETLISKDSSKVRVYVIPTNEELMIAKETERLV
ncbi:MAG: acetate kinase [Clostridia bacterium]|jgi:acetate kinase|nr:acetate kinase [Clostridia bacterium]